MSRDALTPKELRFVDEYIIDWNGSGAAVRAGYSPKTARQTASKLLTKANVQAAVQARMDALSLKSEITVEEVRRDLIAIKEADPRELIDVRRVPCRCCYGANHLPQETPPERHARFAAYDLATKVARIKAQSQEDLARIPAFDDLGGLGYDERKPINAECPVCMGQGEERIRPKDMSALSPQALKLLKGVEITAGGGVKILMHDKTKALELLGRHLAMFTDKSVNLNVNVDAPMPVDAQDAARFYQKLMG